MNTQYSISKGDPSNPHVLCLHGLLGSSRTLLRLIDGIAQAGFHVTAYDQRGHGHSPHSKPGEGYSLKLLAEDVFDFLQAKGIKSTHLVGHSMGARVSLSAAALNPAPIRSLTMLDAAIRIGDQAYFDLRKIIDPLPESYASKAEAESALAHHSASMKLFLLSNLRTQPDGSQRWIFDLNGVRDELLNALQLDQTANWDSIECPVLVARGEKSESFSQREFDNMVTRKPNAQGGTIANAGHWVHADNLTGTVELVVNFLKSVES